VNKYNQMAFKMFSEVFGKLGFKWFRKNDHIFSDELCRWYQENICTGTTYRNGQLEKTRKNFNGVTHTLVGKIWDINDYDRRDRYFARMERLGIMKIKKERNKAGRTIKVWYKCVPFDEWNVQLQTIGTLYSI